VAYIRAHEDAYRGFFASDDPEEVEGIYDTWIERMAQLRTFGDERTLRAAAEAFQLEVHLHQHPRKAAQVHEQPPGAPKQATIHLYFIMRGLHYQPLIPDT
jgi:hypothetical protein